MQTLLKGEMQEIQEELFFLWQVLTDLKAQFEIWDLPVDKLCMFANLNDKLKNPTCNDYIATCA